MTHAQLSSDYTAPSIDGMPFLRNKSEICVHNLMSANPITVSTKDNLRTTEHLMKLAHVRHMPVVDQRNKLLGLITKRDILRNSFSSLSGVDRNFQNKINQQIYIHEVMNASLITVQPDTPIARAAKLMLDNKIGCLPVILPGNLLVGILTEADFALFALDHNKIMLPDFSLCESLCVSDHMSTDLFTVYQNDVLSTVDALMNWRNIRHIPVLNGDNELVGIFTKRDLLAVSVSNYFEDGDTEFNEIKAKIPISQVMQPRVFKTDRTATLIDVAEAMNAKKIGCLPITDEQNKLIGIITEADFVKLFA